MASAALPKTVSAPSGLDTLSAPRKADEDDANASDDRDEVPSNKLRCGQCGILSPKDFRFCVGCGAVVGAPAGGVRRADAAVPSPRGGAVSSRRSGAISSRRDGAARPDEAGDEGASPPSDAVDASAIGGEAQIPEGQFPEAQFPEPELPEAQFPEAQFPEPDLPEAQFAEPDLPEQSSKRPESSDAAMKASSPAVPGRKRLASIALEARRVLTPREETASPLMRASDQGAAPKSVRCRRCGTVCHGEETFCRLCGTALDALRSSPSVPSVRSHEPPESPRPGDPFPLGASSLDDLRLELREPSPRLGSADGRHEHDVGSAPRDGDGDDEVTGRLVVIVEDGSEGNAIDLRGPQMDIGRSEGDIVLEEDPYLSPRHARLFRHEGEWYLRDLGSLNGVYRRLRSPEPLEDGDLLLLGLEVLQFQLVDHPERGLGHAIERGVLLFGSPATARRARLCQRTVEGVVRDVHHLVSDDVTIGREIGDIVFTSDPFMSRRHAAIRWDEETEEYLLTDLGSSNGTYLAIRKDVRLEDGDYIRLGQHLFRVDLTGKPGGVAIAR